MIISRISRYLPFLLVSFLCVTLMCCTKNTTTPETQTSQQGDSIPSKPKPKIGIAFGGGGAKAAAQIGVLQRLEELGIKADYVAGTSMGSVIAALYAAGYTPKEMRRLLKEDKDLWIYDASKAHRLKRDGRKWTGIIDRSTFQNHLDDLLKEKKVHIYHDLEKNNKIPFRCTATAFTLFDYEEVVCSVGVVSRDVTSSVSYPGAYVFAKNKEKKLLDGGMMNNLPVDVVRAMGAEIVIAIDLESDKKDDILELINFGLDLSEKSKYFSDKFSATRWFKVRPDTIKRKANIADADIYIHPPLDNFGIKDYDSKKIEDMIKIGYNTCKKDIIAKQLEELK